MQLLIDFGFQNFQRIVHPVRGFIPRLTSGTDTCKLGQRLYGRSDSDQICNGPETFQILRMIVPCAATRALRSDQPPPLVETKRRDRHPDTLCHLADLHASEPHYPNLGSERARNFLDTSQVETFSIELQEEKMGFMT
ncbi:hypothetical protein BAE27_12405 [Acidithiobacillus caldus]|uniref:Uncharacterized protein n=1 Tax=Acidithiobacillus caldus TaxID=33059 RepID=A0A1E7YKC1_9PROT|nr:hypothetical protein BAE27_12405 [Acidithiobacillus caldus]